MKSIKIILFVCTLLIAVLAFASCDLLHMHEYEEWSVTKNATCTESGEKTRYCSCGEMQVQNVPAIGHTKESVPGKDASCTEGGLTDGAKCSLCGEILEAQKEIPAKKHTYEVSEIAPTCTAEGSKTYTCFCGDSYAEAVPALGHTASASVEENKVDSTCVSIGSCDSVVYCSVCDAEISRENVVIEKKNHIEVVDIGFAADCTNNGLTDGQHCETCGEVLIAQEVIIALGHNEVIDAKVEPDCVNTGLTEGSHCSVCSTVFVEQSVLPAIEHHFEYVEGETVCPDLDNTGLAYVRCTREGCDAREEIVLPTASGQYVTEEEDLYNGIRSYKYTYTNEEYGFTVNHNFDVDIEHTHYYKYEFIRKDGEFTLEAVCQREVCKFNRTKYIDVSVTFVQNTSTCIELGILTYVCVYEDEVYSYNEPSTALLPHRYEYIESESTSPTREQAGLGVIRCSSCGDTVETTLPVIEDGVNFETYIEDNDGVKIKVSKYTHYFEEYDFTFEFYQRNLLAHVHNYDYTLYKEDGKFYLKGICQIDDFRCDTREIILEVEPTYVEDTSTCVSAGKHVWVYDNDGVTYTYEEYSDAVIPHNYQYVIHENTKPTEDKPGIGILQCTQEGCPVTHSVQLPKLAVGVNAELNRVEFEEIMVYDYTYYCEDYDYTFNFEVYIILPHTHDYAYELVPASNLGIGKFNLEGVCNNPECRENVCYEDVAVILVSNTSTCTTAGRQVWQHERNGVIYECRTNLPIFADHIYQIADNEMVKPSYEKEGLGIIICTECNTSANVVLPIVENGVNALVVGNETIDGIDYEVINYIYYSADYNYTFDFNIYNIACDHEHTIDIVTAPTCLSYGYTTTICYDCSTVIVEEFDVVPPIPHCIAEFTGEAVAGEWELAEDMTEHCECVENLLYFAICQYGCGIDFTSPEYLWNDDCVISIVNINHVYGEWHDVMPLEGIPTCMQDRLQARECIICYENGNLIHNTSTGCVQTKVVGASNGHQPGKGVVENYVAPTCESWGSFETAYYCTGCGVEIEELRLVDIIRPIEHNYIVDESISPTKEQEGLGVVKCTECNTSANVVLPIVEIGVNAEMVGIENSNGVGYEIINYTYYSAEYNCTFELIIRNLCNSCDHQPGDGVVMNEVSPTCEEDGRYDVVYYCTKCNIEIYREEKIIEGTAFGHKLADDHQTVFAVVEGTHSVTLPCAACDEDLEYVFVIDGEPTATGHCHNHYDTYTVTATGVTGEITLTIKVENDAYCHDEIPYVDFTNKADCEAAGLVFVRGTGSYDYWLYLCTKCGDWRIAYIIPK